MDSSSIFSEPTLTFEITGPGVHLDPATGLFTFSAAALQEGLSVTGTARDPEGAELARFTLGVAFGAAPPLAVAPALAAAPVLEGPARIGTTLVLDPGAWSGTPAPDLAVTWLVDGEAVPGATGTTFVPRPENDGCALAARVVATNAAGSAAAETETLTVAWPAPEATGTLPDLDLVRGAPPAIVEAAGAFTGAALRFAVAGPGAVIDAESGRLTVATETLATEAPVTVTATNSGGAAETAFRLTIAEEAAEPPQGAPVAHGILPDAVFEEGAAEATISAAAGFEGPDLAFALMTAPEGATIDVGSGLVAIPTAHPLAAAPVTVRARNAAGTAEQSFKVDVLANRTVFDAAPALATLGFVSRHGATPLRWSLEAEGHARLITHATETNHGNWALARGDGRYRCLARWSHPDPSIEWHRPFSLSGRVTLQGTDLLGVRLEIAQRPGPAGPERVLELRQYGSNSEIAILRDVGWEWGVWTWVELELDGKQARGRFWREGASRPAWQIAGETAQLAPGAFGPGGFPRHGASTTIDIRRLEYVPLARMLPAAPPRPEAADWTLEQIEA